jgi:aldose 1-epimerase
MQLSTSNEFSHVVVYTPNAPYFCIENQTCSTDAHNLYTRGYHKESGLEIVESGTSKKGEIRWVFNDL